MISSVSVSRILIICFVLCAIGSDVVDPSSVSQSHDPEVDKNPFTTNKKPENQSFKRSARERASGMDDIEDENTNTNEISPGANDEDDPLLSNDYFEGDIIGVNVTDVAGRNAILDIGKIWDDGVIPYKLSPMVFKKRDRRVIEDAMNEFHKGTCIRFVEKTDEENYINFIKGRGCYSNVGRRTGKQELSLGAGCVKKGVKISKTSAVVTNQEKMEKMTSKIVMHELMHGVGFWHEQSRADRDNFVKILWNNIKKGSEHNFNKYPWTEIQHLDEKYDINSIMHYGPNSFAKIRWQKTIEPMKPTGDDFMGQRERFTDIDIRKLNKLYKCSSKTTTTTGSLNYGSLARKTRRPFNLLGSVLSLRKRFVAEMLEEMQRKDSLRKLVIRRRMLRRRRRLPTLFYSQFY